MTDNVYELKRFKEYLPIDEDITNKERFVYNPPQAPTKIKVAYEQLLIAVLKVPQLSSQVRQNLSCLM